MDWSVHPLMMHRTDLLFSTPADVVTDWSVVQHTRWCCNRLICSSAHPLMVECTYLAFSTPADDATDWSGVQHTCWWCNELIWRSAHPLMMVQWTVQLRALGEARQPRPLLHVPQPINVNDFLFSTNMVRSCCLKLTGYTSSLYACTRNKKC